MARRSSPDRTRSICAASPPSATISSSPSGSNGLDQIRLRAYDGSERRIPFARGELHGLASAPIPNMRPPPTGSATASMVTPPTVYDYHPAEDRLETRKVQQIPSGYDPSQYVTERLMVPTRDGTPDAGVDRLSPRLRAQRPGPALPLRLRRLRHRHRRPASTPTASACSTAATPSPSPISAAATTWAINGISTASSSGAPTRSTISSTPPAA